MYRYLLITYFLFVYNLGFAQLTITGRVIDEDFNPLPMVELSTTENFDTILGKTDLDGYFTIDIRQGIDTVFVGWLGYETAVIPLSPDCANYEVVLLFSYTMHYKSNAKVDRIRKRRFKQLPKLHEQAAYSGIFKQQTPCYSRPFLPWKPDLEIIGNLMKERERKIKDDFKNLQIGDTIRAVYSPSKGSSKTNRTELNQFSSYSNPPPDYACEVIGKIISKDKKKGALNVTYEVINIDQYSDQKLILNNQEVKIGSVFTSNMKYFLVLID